MIAHELAPGFEIRTGRRNAGLLLLCDHAENTIPPEMQALGLPQSERARHIAYDIGAKALTHALSAALGAPAVLSRFSRLVIDPNRGPDDPTLVMRLADGAVIPGNACIDAAGVQDRLTRFYHPYHDAIARTLTLMEETGVMPVILSMHSFTPEMKGRKRPWHATVIWDRDPRFNTALLEALAREPDLCIGENEPYQGGLIDDTIDQHALRRGLAHALLEVRQDLICEDAGIATMAARLTRILPPLLENACLHQRQYFGTVREQNESGR